MTNAGAGRSGLSGIPPSRFAKTGAAATDGLRTGTLAEQIVDRVMESIACDGLQPGDTLPSEAALAAGFGVSRPVVREALRSLAALSVIEIANGRAATVRRLTPELPRTFVRWALSVEAVTPQEVLELRQGIECEAAELAASRITAAGSAQLTTLLERMRVRLSDAAEYGRLDADLHAAIAAASGNRFLIHLVESLRTPTEDVIDKGLIGMRGDRAKYARLQTVHESIVDAICRHDPAAARHEMEQHIADAMRGIGVG
ncbi:MAG: FadR/GntR family transcriptional regulator [Candidatus Dormiibacterota bacterium]